MSKSYSVANKQSTGSTIGDICMVRFNDCINAVLQMKDFFVLPGVKKKLGAEVCTNISENLLDAVAIIAEQAEFVYSELTDSTEQEDV